MPALGSARPRKGPKLIFLILYPILVKSTVRVKLYVICTVLPDFAPKNWSGSPVFKDTMLSGVLRSTSQIHNLIVAAHK